MHHIKGHTAYERLSDQLLIYIWLQALICIVLSQSLRRLLVLSKKVGLSLLNCFIEPFLNWSITSYDVNCKAGCVFSVHQERKSKRYIIALECISVFFFELICTLTDIVLPRWVLPTDAVPTPAPLVSPPGRRITHLKAVRLTRFLSASYFHFMYTGIAFLTRLDTAMSSSFWLSNFIS